MYVFSDILKRRKNINSILMILYLFQFGFLQPICSFVDSQIPVVLFSVFLFFIAFLNNKFNIKKYVFVTFILITTIYFLDLIIYNEYSKYSIYIYLNFIVKSFSGFIIASLDFDENIIYKEIKRVYIFSFFMVILYLLISGNHFEYMRFGYVMLPSLLFSLIFIKENNKDIYSWFIFVLSFILIFVKGSRGPLISILILFIIILLFENKIKKIHKLSITFIAMVGIYIFNKTSLVYSLIKYIYYEKNIRTYSLAKYIMGYEKGIIVSSSGRDDIYIDLINSIKQNIVFGNGIGYLQYNSNGELTAHNIFLQILLEKGVIGFICTIIFWIFLFIIFLRLNKDNNFKNLKNLVVVVFSISFGRLLVSSDLWLRPEYWFGISLLLNYHFYKRYNKNIEGIES